MKRLVFARAARRDFDGIIAYIRDDNPSAAEKVAVAIVATTKRLCEFPEMGHSGRLPDTREFVVAGLPYVIVYQVTREAVIILGVFHGARDLARALTGRSVKS